MVQWARNCVDSEGSICSTHNREVDCKGLFIGAFDSDGIRKI